MTEKGIFPAHGRKRLNPVLLAILALAMSGCSHSGESQFSLAPAPPKFDPAAQSRYEETAHLRAFTGHAIPLPSHIKLSDAGMPMQESLSVGERAALKAEDSGKKCRIQDRIDRKAVIAYQWDDSRLSLDVDGLNMSSTEIEAVKLEYKMRLQPYKTRKEKCRYESGWQGIVGSSYNEMFLRKENTIWNQMDELVNEADDALDKLF